MSWTMTTLSGSLAKAGTYVSSAVSGSMVAKWSDDVEGSINAATRRDWIALSGSTTANFKGMLSDLASDLIAIKMISYDMSGYSSLNEASTMCDILRDNAVRNLELLKETKIQDIML